MDEQNTAAEIIRDLKAVTVTEIAGVPAVITPPGFLLTKYPELMARPQRIERMVTAHDISGFNDYVNRFKSESTAVFAALLPKPRLHGALDYHHPSAPSHCKHNVVCDMAHSEEWTRWMKADRQGMAQKQFGLFLEDNLKDVVEPTGADLLNIALNFASMRAVEFKSSQRLADGTAQIHYIEEEKSTSVKLPERIAIGIPVFRGEGPYKLAARLKYSLKGAEFGIWYELDRPDQVLDTAYGDVIAKVAAATGISVFRGAV